MGSAKEVLRNKCLMPPQISPKFKQFTFKLYGAQYLPKMDHGYLGSGMIDAYMIIKYNNQQLRSGIQVQRVENKEVWWMEEFWFPIEIPAIKEKLEIQIWDQDKGVDGFRDELAASIDLSMKSILKSEQLQNRKKWINLFGAPVEPKPRYSGNGEDMNQDAKIASNWKGRMLIEYSITPPEEGKYEKFPVFKKQKIPKMN